jgi:hypothetical protein
MYLTTEPNDIHSRKTKYINETLMRNGSRMRQMHIDNGVQRKLAGAGGTGRKGAIAVPVACR